MYLSTKLKKKEAKDERGLNQFTLLPPKIRLEIREDAKYAPKFEPNY